MIQFQYSSASLPVNKVAGFFQPMSQDEILEHLHERDVDSVLRHIGEIKINKDQWWELVEKIMREFDTPEWIATDVADYILSENVYECMFN